MIHCIRSVGNSADLEPIVEQKRLPEIVIRIDDHLVQARVTTGEQRDLPLHSLNIEIRRPCGSM
jgi:hypothetical protein